MSHQSGFRAGQARAVVVAVFIVTGLIASALPASATVRNDRRDPTVTRVAAASRGHHVHADLLGVNSRWSSQGDGVWDARASEPVQTIIRRARRAGIQSLRYPGGTVATMFDWKEAVGDSRGCQVDGHGGLGRGFPAAKGARAYGPAEFMRVADAIGAKTQIMAPFVGESPRDAADWVEYMNSPVGANPNGGRDWARVRAAEGHPAPYRVKRWEVGNEAHVSPHRYNFSIRPFRAVRQYAFGGERHVHDEPLGKRCQHPGTGVPSNGRRNQVFTALYKGLETKNFSATINGTTWKRVNDLSRFGPRAKVYVVQEETAQVVFGDGKHGRIPPEGAVVHAAYTDKFPGFFRFVREMKAVDRSIDVCATWAQPLFVKAVRPRHYDCLTAHPITNFEPTGDNVWNSALEGHDRMMLGLAQRQDYLTELLSALPGKTKLWLTEFKAINGDFSAFPAWSGSASHAIYMACMYVMLLKQGVAYASGGDFTAGSGQGAVFSDRPYFTYSAQAMMREALVPMFTAGGHVVHTRVLGDPRRTPRIGAGSYSALTAVATKSGHQLWLLVVNRLPGDAVSARVTLDGFNARSKARVRRVTSRHFTNWNHPNQPPSVRLHTSFRRVGRSEFSASFPAHSVTVLRLTRR